MRPIEIIHSLERLTAAQKMQSQPNLDPHAATGDLNVKKIKDEVELNQSTIQESDELDNIDPDAQKKQSGKSPNEKSESQEEASSTDDSKENDDPDKGHFLDITA